MSLHLLPWVVGLLPVLSALLCSLGAARQARRWAPPLARQLRRRCALAGGATALASLLVWMTLEAAAVQTLLWAGLGLLAPLPVLWALAQGAEAQKHQELSHWQRDGLTGLLTRKALLERALALPRAGGGGVVLLDIDHFKGVNERHLHAGGDRVLAHAARRLSALVRLSDLLGRYGGEEFCLLLPGRPADHSAALADRLLADARCQRVRMPDGSEQGYTLSAGVAACAVWPDAVAGWDDLLARADAALFAAKRSGRDRLMRHDLLPADPKAAEASIRPSTPQLLTGGGAGVRGARLGCS
ncbi:MAG: GGDEF domain-containing protein [Burkholderiales bacterium]|nr:GGDEF domain-containing protein [Burkholderiales bacterium]